MKRSEFLTAIAAVAMGFALSGCAGYRLGSMLPKDIKTVHVPAFVNHTKEPNIEVDTTQKFIQELQRDGSLKLADKVSADAILDVTVTDVELQPLAYTKSEFSQARQYRLWISAKIVMRTAKEDKVIVERSRVRGQAVFDMVGDLTTSKQRAIPTAAQDLGHNIVEAIVEVW